MENSATDVFSDDDNTASPPFILHIPAKLTNQGVTESGLEATTENSIGTTDDRYTDIIDGPSHRVPTDYLGLYLLLASTHV